MENYITYDLFMSFFKPFIRVLFNWNRFENERWPIQVNTIKDLATVSSWYMPWNVDKEGKEVKYNSTNARPIQLVEVSNLLPHFEKKRQQSIINLSKIFIESLHPQHTEQFIVPTYTLPNGARLIMDGNHRLSALMIAKVPFRLLVFSINGPLDNAILPELRHWEESPIVHQWE